MMLLVRADRTQAYLLKDILAQNGIKAHVFNENMSSIVGDTFGGYVGRLDAVADRHATAVARAETQPRQRGFRGLDAGEAAEMAEIVLRDGLPPARDLRPQRRAHGTDERREFRVHHAGK